MYPPSFEDNRPQLVQRIKHICASYGLYGNVVYYSPSPFTCDGDSNRNRLYIIAGISPAFGEDQLPEWIQPDQIIMRNKRNIKLFYPDAWALELTPGTQEIEVLDQLKDYAEHVSFLSFQYRDHGLPMPEKLRLAEVNHLMTLYDQSLWNSDQPRVQRKYQSGLDWFFKREKSTMPFRQKWLDYYRSEKFPDEKGPISKLRGYFKRNNPEVSIQQLFDTNENLKKLELQEHEFRYFRKFIADCYPEVSFAVGDREVVNHGVTPPSASDTVSVRNVTLEEYDAVRKERFAEEGFEALANMNPSYWVFRDIYYRAVDEPIIASVRNSIRLQYAKCNPLEELCHFGEMSMKAIPESSFMNFVSLAKTNGLRFYIDTKGDYALPSLDTVHVLYNVCQEDKMFGILERVNQDKVIDLQDADPRPSLENQITYSKQHSYIVSAPETEQKTLPERD